MNENEEIFETEGTPVSDEAEDMVSREEELSAALSAAKEENDRLRAKCICAEMGVPAEMAEDIITLGRFYSSRDGVDFEEAARAAFGRISAAGSGITTGVSVLRSKSDISALRRAFGLKG
ncbi:MAG: hypothetical protein MSJ26_10620 [Oscillospiraceae bacterium]|nr:hypothetical protein [Oscillospiraceae bacterium]